MTISTTGSYIRWLVRRDMEEVLSVENRSFDFPWTEEEFLVSLRQRNCIGIVIEVDHRVVGYTLYELHPDSLSILNLAVCSWHRRKDLGSEMIGSMKGKLSLRRRRKITAVVRETNLESQLFFKSCGFRATEVLPKHYDETIEDAFLFEYRFVPPSAEVLEMEAGA